MYPLWDVKDRSIKLREWKQLEQSQWLARDELQRRQWQHLEAMLVHAWDTSPFYRERMQQAGLVPGDMRSPADYSRLPVTTKHDIRAAGERMISTRFRRADLVGAKTGGSTGVSLDLLFDKQCQERRNAAAMRSDGWAGWQPGMYRGALWGNPPRHVSLKRRLRNLLLDRTFVLDTMQMSPASMDAFVAEANRHGQVAFFGHSHSLYILARHLRDGGLPLARAPRAIISTSMMLLANERAVIEQVMGCRVSDRYGCEEVGLIASECERHDGMHINVDHLYVEVLRDDGSAAAPGEPGKVVLSDLSNHGMPLLRYRVEDVAVPSARDCPCGRGQPLLEGIAGRVADFLRKRDGSLVAGVSLVERTLTAISGIEQMQLVQDRIDAIHINRVRAPDHTPRADELLLAELRSVFGADVDLVINDVQAIPQARNGKHRFSICNI